MSNTKRESRCDVCIYKSYLFNYLTKQETALVNLNKKEIVIEKGEIICQEGKPIKYLVYLREGLMKLYKTGAGRTQQIISIATPQDFIGLLSVFSNTEYVYSLSALEDSSLCMIELDVIKKIILQNGKFALSLIEKMNKISDVVLSNKVELGVKQLRGRIAHILLMFAEQVYRSKIEIRNKPMLKKISELG